ncbi:hypothetical protein SAMD00019534_102490 [Acytostelium subglobosum LB1]|uniref:hypothetical protein n=1 Tax=Acytostelium subglobosum LB1 TaxID=1410327 RepID=UPI000644D6C9|nr:hypothetical protein SAMD00019534_102490 [Acytostelium subglobosum LB1]GAM27074.1 hypothetical protein SAMD00019534_102490 [Acytostelium subglobosum LB1]|eukprot:XP_012749954.1 hypothetical protein SAMD00019534_102490 [Acytostelium subglobosum LB1]
MGISTVIEDFLYLGAARDTKNVFEMKRRNITHIVSCAGTVHNESEYRSLRAHNLEDVPEQDILTFIDEAYLFIEQARKEDGVVFVHCLAGRSRSPTVILAYLMIAKRLPLNQLYTTLHQTRSCVQPNDGFMIQLMQLEQKVLGKCSIVLDEWKNAAKAQITAIRTQRDLEALKKQEFSTAEYQPKVIAPLDPTTIAINAYTDSIVTPEVVLKVMDQEGLYSQISSNITYKQSSYKLIGRVKKLVCKELFTLTNGGEVLRQQNPDIAWKDISQNIDNKVLGVLEKDIFALKIPQ